MSSPALQSHYVGGTELQARVLQMSEILVGLINAPLCRFDNKIYSRIPERHGVYAIYRIDHPKHEVIRAGRTKTAADGLFQRIYQNHYMGQQNGNLRAQLVSDGICPDKTSAKTWMQRNAAVRFIEIEDDSMRMWVEYFMLSVLRPKYCD